MDAIAELSAERGYEATKIGDIVSRAGVARKTLYDNFEGKEDVFLAAFDSAVDEVVGRIEERCDEAGEEWEERLQAGMARMCMVEAMSATPAATRHYEEAVQRFVAMTRASVPHYEQLPETIEETLVGGVAWIVHQNLRRGEAEKAEGLLGELSEFVLAPYRAVAAAR